MTTTYYELSYKRYKFIVKKTIDRKAKLTSVSIGGRRECMQFLHFHTEKYIILQGVTKGKDCAVNIPLDDKTGTRAMIEAGIACIFRLFSKVNEIHLTDNSMRDCENGRRIILSTMYAVRYGNTYYGHYFKASPVSDNIRDALASINHDFSMQPKAITFADIWSLIARNLPPDMTSNVSEHKMWYLSMYNESPTLFQYFSKLNDHGCGKLNFWIDALVLSKYGINLINSDWVISRGNQVIIEMLKVNKPLFEPPPIDTRRLRLFGAGVDQLL